MQYRIQKVLSYLKKACVTPNDTQDERLRKFMLLLVSSFCSVAGLIWGTFYFLIFGVSIHMFLPYSFSILVGLSLLYTVKTKNYKILLFNQLFFILITPVILQWTLGGFARSGVVILWSILCPFGSLMFQPLKVVLRWFFAYIILVGISFYFDEYFFQYAPEISPVQQIIFLVMNVVGMSFTFFFTMMYFVRAFQEAHNLTVVFSERNE